MANRSFDLKNHNKTTASSRHARCEAYVREFNSPLALKFFVVFS